MIAWEYAAIIFKGYSLTNFMKQDLFIKKQFEMVKIVYSIVVIEILILVASLPVPDPLKLMLQNLSLFSKAPGGGGDSAYERGGDARRLA